MVPAAAQNLGKKNGGSPAKDIERICDTFLAFEETEESKIFPNETFGYGKVTVERPLRLSRIDPKRAYCARRSEHSGPARGRRERATVIKRSTSAAWRRPDPVQGRFEVTIGGKHGRGVRADSDLRDSDRCRC